MASQPAWKFCCDVVDTKAKEELTEDVQDLLRSGWNPTKANDDIANDGIVKDFDFPSFNQSLDFYTLVSSSSITNRHHAALTLTEKGVSAVWTTHEPSNGLSRRDYKLARICDLIAGVVRNDEKVWCQIPDNLDHKWWKEPDQTGDAVLTRTLLFKHHSYITDFVHAIGVAVKSELLQGLVKIRSKPPSVEVTFKARIETKLTSWLAFVDTSVRPSTNIEDKEIESKSSDGRSFHFRDADKALNFYALVHRASISNKHPVETSITGNGAKVEVTVIHDGKMTRLFDLFSRTLNGEAHGSYQGDSISEKKWYFRSHTKVMNFSRAVALVGHPDEPWSIISDYNSVQLNLTDRDFAKLSPWLNTLLTYVVKPDEKNKVPRCDSAL